MTFGITKFFIGDGQETDLFFLLSFCPFQCVIDYGLVGTCWEGWLGVYFRADIFVYVLVIGDTAISSKNLFDFVSNLSNLLDYLLEVGCT